MSNPQFAAYLEHLVTTTRTTKVLTPEAATPEPGVRVVDFERELEDQGLAPIPCDWFVRLSKLPRSGQTLTAACLVLTVCRSEQRLTVTVSPDFAARFHLSPRKMRTALRYLEGAGLIAVEHQRGSPPLITVLDPTAIVSKEEQDLWCWASASNAACRAIGLAHHHPPWSNSQMLWMRGETRCGVFRISRISSQ